MIILMLVLIGLALIAFGGVWMYKKISRYLTDRSNYNDTYRRKENSQPPKFPNLLLPGVLLLVGLVWLASVSTGSAQVPATDIAVVENTVTGQLSTLDPGTHIFPFQPALIPFVTQVTNYTLRRSNVEVGSPEAGKEFDVKKAVEADSNSPGRPAVYFWARVWAYPNKEMVTELHRRYGPNYLHNWVERVYIAALKSVQGKSEYPYVGRDRVGFQHEVEKVLQDQLLGQDGVPIVYVQQLAVVNFKFSEATEAFLQSVQKVEFDRQQAEQLIEVNKKQQEAQKIAADTSYIVETRNAERDRDANISRATGSAEAVKIAAEAERYRIEQTYTAESEGIKKVQTVLTNAPEGYLNYQKTKQWDGQLPQYFLGSNGVVPFIDLKPEKGK